MASLKGKTAIVTGASKMNGIGAATAIALAEQGANIIVHYSTTVGPAEEVIQKIKALGVEALAVRADATRSDFGTTLVDEAPKAFGTDTIDIIVNNAGTAAVHQEIVAVPLESWDEIYHVNVRAPFLLIQAALPKMKEGGRIIDVGSIAVKLGHE